MTSSLASNLQLLGREWPGNHSRFGWRAALRCFAGEWRLRRSAGGKAETGLDCLTFSVVPGLTLFWQRINQESMNGHVDRVLIGDCSGGLEPEQFANGMAQMAVLPCLNRKHGEKLDLFLRRATAARLVLISDDDVFQLSPKPIQWATREVGERGAAVASIRPRSHTSTLMAPFTNRPMGSACILIDRHKWLEHDLSLGARPADQEGAEWFYDTGDWANRKLVELGERIATIPQELETNVVSPRAMSTWLLKFHKHSPGMLAEVADNQFRRRKARRAFLVAREIDRRTVPTGGESQLLPSSTSGRLDSATRSLLSEADNARIETEVGALFEKLDATATSPLPSHA